MKDGDVTDLLLLPRRVVHQPTPEVHPGGDCGACVLAGLLGMSVPDVYDKIQRPMTTGWQGPASFSRKGIVNGLEYARQEGLVEDVLSETPRWHQKWDEWSEWGDPGWVQSGPWRSYVRLGMQAGYYAVANVRFDKDGPLKGNSDHWVLLCGARTRWRAFDGERCVGDHQFLVSCSARSTPDEEWVEPLDFLRQRGGFNVVLIKPAPRKVDYEAVAAEWIDRRGLIQREPRKKTTYEDFDRTDVASLAALLESFRDPR